MRSSAGTPGSSSARWHCSTTSAGAYCIERWARPSLASASAAGSVRSPAAAVISFTAAAALPA